MRPRLLCLALLAVLALSACGLKGPLYLPNPDQPAAGGDKPPAAKKQ